MYGRFDLNHFTYVRWSVSNLEALPGGTSSPSISLSPSGREPNLKLMSISWFQINLKRIISIFSIINLWYLSIALPRRFQCVPTNNVMSKDTVLRKIYYYTFDRDKIFMFLLTVLTGNVTPNILLCTAYI